MKCSYSAEDLIRYTEGLMCDAEKDELKKHLDICESCRSRLGILKLTEDHLKEDVSNNETMYLKVMGAIDKDRYLRKKSKYKLGAFVARMAPFIKPSAAVILILVLSLVAVTQRQHISNVMSSLGEVFSKHDNLIKDDENKNNKNSKFFTAESVTELAKGQPPGGWVLSGDSNIKDMERQVKLKFYVKPDSDPSSSKNETGEVIAYLHDCNELYDLGLVVSF
ncbi:MAG: zf-HC2 domain-containing protein [Bacillota bacterium]|nr:zf-HC2 domain-containing protein [Bacillota bacterium]